ncbi:hypothetical protein DHW03_02725 [Pedobacter yonginense]|uniref:CcoQ/FixQ family Cbb3-type cytochrome c oxidase assembly chaperone n=1 Tax=Pedobacter yonginense TaxID=651869 RepID=A0A317EQL2_9SPHI|nr:hypothetical protein [Pedobacter yonginense]PWS28772.1 hypothetical protein DHW03_02725 [Pedobacter yonginense]
MFNQIKDLAGGEIYLITSLLMFMVFFVIVGIYLIKLNQKHIEVMSALPIEENQTEVYEED